MLFPSLSERKRSGVQLYIDFLVFFLIKDRLQDRTASCLASSCQRCEAELRSLLIVHCFLMLLSNGLHLMPDSASLGYRGSKHVLK